LAAIRSRDRKRKKRKKEKEGKESCVGIREKWRQKKRNDKKRKIKRCMLRWHP